MDAVATKGHARWLLDTPQALELARLLATSLMVLLAMASLLLGARRASGALTEPLSPGTLLLLGVVMAAAALAFRFLHSPTWQLWSVPTTVLILFAAAVSLPDSPNGGLFVLWSTLVLEEAYSWGRLRQASRQASRFVLPSVELSRESPTSPASIAVLEALEPDESVTQQFTRRREPDGGETMEGWLRVDVPRGERVALAHLAICPQFESLPECFAEQGDGPPAEVKVAQILTYGVRFEIKLERAAKEPTSVLVEFVLQEQAAE